MTYRIACLGAGFFSQFHHDGWARLPDAKIVGVADHDMAKAQGTGHPAFDNLEQMLADTTPDILDIVVPPSAHAAAIKSAIAQGIPTIICQKPFCASLEDATEIVALAKSKGTRLIVHENFRFQPWFRTIYKAIHSGQIGAPLQATFRLRPGDGQGPEAYLARQPYFQTMPRFMFHETGVHYADTFRYLFGNPTAVYADLRRVNPVIAGEDAGIVTFDHPHGVRTILDANRNADHAATNLRRTMGEGLFEGTSGTLTLTGDGAVHLRNFAETTATCILPPDTSQNFGGDCTYHLQAHVLKALKAHGHIENIAENYIKVLEIEAAVYRSSENGVKVTLDARF